jgi:hypothetical protein
MKENESNFVFISFHLFSRIGTFQRVADDSNKKNSLPSPIPFYGALLKFKPQLTRSRLHLGANWS